MLTLSLLPTRKCYACPLAKSVGEFRPHYAAKVSARCRDCDNVYVRKWKAARPDMVKASRAAFNARMSPGARAKENRYHRELRQRHPEASRASGKRWRDANPEKMQAHRDAWLAWPGNKELDDARRAAWTKANPDKVRAYHSVRNARKAGGGGSHTATDIAAKMEAQGFRCIYCPAALRTVAYEVDHIIPLSRGGSDSADNIQCLCRRCNRRKHDRTHAEFAEIVAAM